MVEMSGLEVVRTDPDAWTVVELYVDAACRGVGCPDRPALAVEDPGAAIVSRAGNTVSGGEAAAADDELVGAEPALILQQLASPGVEVVHVVAARGDHQQVPVRARPVVDERGTSGLGGVADGDLPAVTVGARPVLHLAAAQRVECLAIPGSVLASYFVEMTGGQPFGESVKRAARLNLRELAVVADEDELRVRLLSCFSDPGEVTGAHHPCLVDDEHAVRWKPVTVVQAACKPGERHGRDRGLVVELECCSS